MISNKEHIATFVLYQLGGAKNAIHLEDIASKCHEIAPARFSWQLEKYRKYPDIKAVFYALDATSRTSGGDLVRKIENRRTGGQRYRLTQAGAQWIKQNGHRIATELKISNENKPEQEIQQALRELKKRDRAFKKYKKDGEKSELSIYELIDFLGCSLETSPTAVRKKFTEMQTQAEMANDAEIEGFLRVARTKFSDLLSVGQS